MARLKSPKRANESNTPVATSNAPVSGTGTTSTGAAAAAPALESSSEPNATKPATMTPKNAKPEIAKPEIVKPEIVKPEIVKKDTRANLVPINLDEEIRRLAYLLSERRGFEPGHEAEDWMKAEREIRERYHQQSA